MAIRVNNGDTTLTSTTGFDTVTACAAMHASGLTTINSSKYSAVFTAPNTTNKCTGAILFITSPGISSGGATIDVALQEYNGASWADKVVVSVVTPFSFLGYNMFRFAAPYQFTTTTAGYYRIRVGYTGTFSSYPITVTDSGNTLPWASWIQDLTGAIASTDNLYVLGANNATRYTVTRDGTVTFGSGASTEVAVARSTNNALNVGSYGSWVSDVAASVTTTIKGNISISDGGVWQRGSVASPYPIAYVDTLILDEATAGGDYGIVIGSVSTSYPFVLTFTEVGSVSYGTPTTNYRGLYTSGVGTAADPFIMASSVDWAVGEEIVIGAASNSATNYNECETRFIKTKNSATSYVLSTTAGGAEAALTYTHSANVEVRNLTRNVITKSSAVARGWYAQNNNITPGTTTIQWVRHENTGSNIANKEGLRPCTQTAFTQTTVFDYNVGITGGQTGSTPTTCWYMVNNRTVKTFTGLTLYSSGATVDPTYPIFVNAPNTTIQDLAAFGMYGNGAYITGSKVNLLNYRAYGCNRAAGSGLGGLLLGPGYGGTVTGEIHCSRKGLVINGTGPLATFTGVLFGTKGYNNSGDLSLTAGLSPDFLLDSCSFGSPLLWSTGYEPHVSGADGTRIRFKDFGAVAGAHRWYDNYGVYYATGAGLTDTTVRNSGEFCVRMENPGYAYGAASWAWDQFVGNVQANPDKTVQISVWCKINNAAFWAGVSTMPRLTVNYDNGTTFCPASAIATQTTGWQKLYLVFDPATSYPSCTVTLSMQTDAAGSNAYVYWADRSFAYPSGYVGETNTLKYWAGGMPIPEQISTALSAQDVWNAASSTDYGAGSMGERIKAMLVRQSTVASATGSTLVLDSSASAVDDYYNENYVVITSGTGTGQARRITDYTGSSKTLAINRAWTTNPDSSSTYAIIPFFDVARAVFEALTATSWGAGSMGEWLKQLHNASLLIGPIPGKII